MYEETVDWMNQQKKKGTLIDSWAVPGESTIAICEHSSVEDLAQTISSMPLQGFLNFEIYPLCDINVFMKSQIEYMKHAEKALAGKEMAGVR